MAIFVPDRKVLWEQLSKEIHANLIEAGHWKGDRIEASHGNWTLYLDSNTIPTGDTDITYTRMQAPFVSKDGMMFKIHRKSLFSGISKILGMKDIQVGHVGFDEDFIIKGNDEKQIVRLFNNAAIRDLILLQPTLSLEIKSTEGTDEDDSDMELYFNIASSITDITLLERLFDLFMEVLDELVRIDSAYSRAPDVEIFE